MDKYARLHAAGVIHGSPWPKHWLRAAGAPIAELRLIDFGLGRVREAEGVPEGLRRCGRVHGLSVFERLAREEMSRVKDRLRLST